MAIELFCTGAETAECPEYTVSLKIPRDPEIRQLGRILRYFLLACSYAPGTDEILEDD